MSRQIADYVLTELRRPFNADVTKLLFAGGLTETYGLMDFIKEEVDKAQAEAGRTPVETLTLSVFAESGSDEFSIRPYEDSVYAAAAGAAIMLALGYELRTVLALSYGTWFRTKLDPAGSSVQRSVKTLEFFAGAQKGDPIRESFLTASVRVGGSRIQIGTAKYSPYIEKEEMFSTFLTQKDIDRYAREVKSGRMRSDIFLTAADSDPVMAVGDPGSALRSEAVAKAGLRTVTGGEKSRIMFWYRGRRVAVPVDLRFREGIHMDADGRATPIIGTRGFFDTAHAKDVWQVVYLNDDFTQSGKVAAPSRRQPRQKQLAAHLLRRYHQPRFVDRGRPRFCHHGIHSGEQTVGSHCGVLARARDYDDKIELLTLQHFMIIGINSTAKSRFGFFKCPRVDVTDRAQLKVGILFDRSGVHCAAVATITDDSTSNRH